MKYGFIGCGNMGGAIARALSKSTKEIIISDRTGKAKALADELGCVYSDIQTIASECTCIFLAVKPQMMESVLSPLRDCLAVKKPLLVTMAAGLTIQQIESFAGTSLPVIRIMPNTPVAVGKGLVVYCYNEHVGQASISEFLNDMQFCGRMDMLDEHLMDAASALSGCGPAFMYIFLESLADGAVACGIPRAKALEYAAATMAGAAEMVLVTGQHPGVLKDAVCSPGGSTIVGVKTLEKHGFRGTVMDCILSAYQKNQQLGK